MGFDLRLTAGEEKLQGCIESGTMKRVAGDALASRLRWLEMAFAWVVFSLVFFQADRGQGRGSGHSVSNLLGEFCAGLARLTGLNAGSFANVLAGDWPRRDGRGVALTP